jgi:uncharacterized protein (DUF4415 family)
MPLDEAFWQEALRRLPPSGPQETQPACAIDEHVLAWFRAHGPGYQTRMNAVLRAHVEARKRCAR